MMEFTHSPRGLIHVEGKISKETDETFTINYYNGRIKFNKCDVYNCHVRPDRSIIVDLPVHLYPRAIARTEGGRFTPQQKPKQCIDGTKLSPGTVYQQTSTKTRARTT